MKKIVLLLTCALCSGHALLAQVLPKWTEKARKAVFSVVTYNKDNQILNTGNGFYIDNNGTAVSDYTLFRGAERAVIVTADGKELPVDCILGANDMYDVVKFRTPVDKKTAASLQPVGQAAGTGETVYLLPYSTQKATTVQSGSIARCDTIANGSFYYTVNLQTADKNVSCPVMNAAGQVIGLVQKSADPESKESYVIGIEFATSLTINALSGNDMALKGIGIRKGLPDDEAQALVYVYMQSATMDNNSYLNLLNDFLAQFPNSSEGYQRRASCYMTFGDDSHNSLADNDLKKSLEVADKKDEAHYSLAKLFYTYNLNRGETPAYTNWGWERAADEISQAMAQSDQPLYQQTAGDIYFAMQKYPEAYEAYEVVNRSELATAASFYAAAKAKELTEGSQLEEVAALMDSAVAQYAKPYGKEAAPYLYERARVKTELKKFREAVIDYNDFYDAMLGQVTADFFVTREQAEVQCRMYQQAINDVNRATELEPENAEMWMEKGSVHLRVNQLDEAIQALQHSLSLDAQNAVAYRMLGYCQVQQGNKKEGLSHLQKALEMGDTVAQGLIEKYK